MAEPVERDNGGEIHAREAEHELDLNELPILAQEDGMRVPQPKTLEEAKSWNYAQVVSRPVYIGTIDWPTSDPAFTVKALNFQQLLYSNENFKEAISQFAFYNFKSVTIELRYASTITLQGMAKLFYAPPQLDLYGTAAEYLLRVGRSKNGVEISLVEGTQPAIVIPYPLLQKWVPSLQPIKTGQFAKPEYWGDVCLMTLTPRRMAAQQSQNLSFQIFMSIDGLNLSTITRNHIPWVPGSDIEVEGAERVMYTPGTGRFESADDSDHLLSQGTTRSCGEDALLTPAVTSVSFLKSQRGYLDTFTITKAQKAGDRLATIYPSPTRREPCEDSLAFLSQFSELWHGSIEYTMQVSKAFFHSFNILVCWTPGHDPPTTLSAATNYPHIVYTFNGNRALAKFRVNYGVEDYYLHTRKEDPTYANYYDNINGRVDIFLVNDLIVPTGVSETVDVVIWRNGASNLRFFSPYLPTLLTRRATQGGDEEVVEATLSADFDDLNPELVGSDRPAPFYELHDLKIFMNRMFKSKITAPDKVDLATQYWPPALPVSPFNIIFSKAETGSFKGGFWPGVIAKQYLTWIGGMHWTVFTDVDVPQYQVIGYDLPVEYDIGTKAVSLGTSNMQKYADQDGGNPFTNIPTSNFVTFQTPAICPQRAFYSVDVTPSAIATGNSQEQNRLYFYNHLVSNCYERVNVGSATWIEFRVNLASDFEVGVYRGIHMGLIDEALTSPQNSLRLPAPTRRAIWDGETPGPVAGSSNGVPDLNEWNEPMDDYNIQMYKPPNYDLRARLMPQDRMADAERQLVQVAIRKNLFTVDAYSILAHIYLMAKISPDPYSRVAREDTVRNILCDIDEEYFPQNAELLHPRYFPFSTNNPYWRKFAQRVLVTRQSWVLEALHLSTCYHYMRELPFGFNMLPQQHPTRRFRICPFPILDRASLGDHFFMYKLACFILPFITCGNRAVVYAWILDLERPIESLVARWSYDSPIYYAYFATRIANFEHHLNPHIQLPTYVLWHTWTEFQNLRNDIEDWSRPHEDYREYRVPASQMWQYWSHAKELPFWAYEYDHNLDEFDAQLHPPCAIHELDFVGSTACKDFDPEDWWIPRPYQHLLPLCEARSEGAQVSVFDLPEEPFNTFTEYEPQMFKPTPTFDIFGINTELQETNHRIAKSLDKVDETVDRLGETITRVGTAAETTLQSATQTSTKLQDVIDSVLDGSFFSNLFPGDTGALYANQCIDLMEAVYLNTPAKWIGFCVKLANIMGLSTAILRKVYEIISSQENAPTAQGLVVNTDMNSVIPNVLTMVFIGIGLKMTNAADCSNASVKTTWEYFQWKCRELNNVRLGVSSGTTLFKDIREMLVNAMLDLGIMQPNPDKPTDAEFDRLFDVLVDDISWLEHPDNCTNFHLQPDKISHFEEIWGRVHAIWKLWAKRTVAQSQMPKFIAIYRKFEKCLERIVENSDSEIFRVDPYQVGIEGKPGIGKGGVMFSLAKVIGHIQGWPDKRLLFTRTPGMKHFDGYGAHPIYVEDDKDQFDGADELLYDIMFKSNAEVTVPMARLEQKGAKFRSYLMLHTTNVLAPKSTGVSCNEAYTRRRDYLVKMTLPDGKPKDHENFRFQRVDGVNTDKLIGHDMTIYEFFSDVCNKFREHMRIQFRLMKQHHVTPIRPFKFFSLCDGHMMKRIYNKVVTPVPANTPLTEIPQAEVHQWEDLPCLQAGGSSSDESFEVINQEEDEIIDPECDAHYFGSIPGADPSKLHPNSDLYPLASQKIDIDHPGDDIVNWMYEERKDLYISWLNLCREYQAKKTPEGRETIASAINAKVSTARADFADKRTAPQAMAFHMSYFRDNPKALGIELFVDNLIIEDNGEMTLKEAYFDGLNDIPFDKTTVSAHMVIDQDLEPQLVIRLCTMMQDDEGKDYPYETDIKIDETHPSYENIFRDLVERAKQEATTPEEKKSIMDYLTRVLRKKSKATTIGNGMSVTAQLEEMKRRVVLLQNKKKKDGDLTKDDADELARFEKMCKFQDYLNSTHWRKTCSSDYASPPHHDGPRYSHPLLTDSITWFKLFAAISQSYYAFISAVAAGKEDIFDNLVIMGHYKINVFSREISLPIPIVPVVLGGVWSRWFINKFVPLPRRAGAHQKAHNSIMFFRGLFDDCAAYWMYRWCWYNAPFYGPMMVGMVFFTVLKTVVCLPALEFTAAAININPYYSYDTIKEYWIWFMAYFLDDRFTLEGKENFTHAIDIRYTFVPPEILQTDSFGKRMWNKLKQWLCKSEILSVLFSGGNRQYKFWYFVLHVCPYILALLIALWSAKTLWNFFTGNSGTVWDTMGMTKEEHDEYQKKQKEKNRPVPTDEPKAQAIQTHEHADVPDDGKAYFHTHLCVVCGRPYGHSHRRNSVEVSQLFPLICSKCKRKEENQAKSNLMAGKPGFVSVTEDSISDSISIDDIIVERGYAQTKASKTIPKVTLKVQRYSGDKANKQNRVVKISPQSLLSEDEATDLLEDIPDYAPGFAPENKTPKPEVKVIIPAADKIDPLDLGSPVVQMRNEVQARVRDIRSNQGMIRVVNSELRLNYIGVCDRIILIPAHFFQGRKNGELECTITRLGNNHNVKINIVKDVRYLEEVEHSQNPGKTTRDVCFVVLRDLRIPTFKDLRNLFVSGVDNSTTGVMAPVRKADGYPAHLYYYDPITYTPGTLDIPKLELKGRVLYKDGPQFYATGASWYYNAKTVNGMCGSVLFSEKVGSNGAIIGIHVIGHTNSDSGASDLVTKEMFESAFPDLIVTQCLADPIEELKDYGFDISTELNSNIELPFGTAYYPVGTIPQISHRPTKSDLEPSLLFDEIFKHQTEMSVLDPHDPRNLSQDHPYVKAGQKYRHLEQFPISIQEEVWKDTANEISAAYVSSGYDGPMRVLTLDEAINGIPGYIDPIQMRTSEGFPFSTQRPTGSVGRMWMFDLVGVDEDGRNIYKAKDILVNAVNKIINTARTERKCVLNYFTDWLKDERRKLTKIEEGKTRMFSGHNIAWLLVLRMYFQCITSFLLKHGQNIGFAPGMDVHGADATEFVNRLLTHPHFVALDFSMWDETVQNYELGMCVKIYLLIVERHYVFPSIADKVETIDVMVVIIQSTKERFHVYANFIYYSNAGVTSGSKFTTEWNTIVNKNRQKMVFLYIVRNPEIFDLKDPPGLLSLQYFRENTQGGYYGDDVVDTTSDDSLSFYNLVTRVKCLSMFGYSVTPANKDKKFDGSLVTPFEEVTFLKSRFVRDSRYPTKWHFAMDRTTIQELTNWVRRDIDPVFALSSNIRDAQEMAYAHGEEYFDSFTNDVMLAATRKKIPIIPETFEHFDHRWLRAHGLEPGLVIDVRPLELVTISNL